MDVDILIVAAEWPQRALLRAQLIEEGYEVQAVGAWDEAELLLRKRAVDARAIVFALDRESHPEAALATLARLARGSTVLVLTSAAALAPSVIRRLGFDQVLARPYSVRDVIDAVARLINKPSKAT